MQPCARASHCADDLRIHCIFIGSLRAHYAGAVTLFTADPLVNASRAAQAAAADIQSYLRRQRVVTRLVPKDLGVPIPDVFPRRRIIFVRFILYALACTAGEYDACLACDFKDILFQSDPFASASLLWRSARQPALIVGMEHTHAEEARGEHNEIGRSPINSRWVMACYGRPDRVPPPDPRWPELRDWSKCYGTAALAQVSRRPVLNDGALLGTPAAFGALRRLFAHNLHRAALGCRWKLWIACGDQGVFNYAVHTRARELANVEIQLQPTGSAGGSFGVLYRQALRHWELPQRMAASGGYVLNDDGARTPLVHMWDRFPTKYWKNFTALVDAEAHATLEKGRARSARARETRADAGLARMKRRARTATEVQHALG